MSVAGQGAFEGHGVSLDALAHDWRLAIDWAAEIFLEAAFPAARCAWVVRQAAAELESLRDEPEVRTSWSFFEQLYAPHPRQRPLHGDARSLAEIDAGAAASFHRQSLDRGVVAVVSGLIDEDAVERHLRDRLASLEGAATALASPAAPRGTADRRREVTLEGGEQAHLYVGHLSVAARDPDFVTLELLAVVLGAGSGLSGRIPQRIREREGLAYAAHAHTVAGAGLDPGRVVVYVGTAPDLIEQAERGVIEEVTRLAAEGISEPELEEARAYLLGREPFRRETARQWADLLLEATHLGVPFDDPQWRAAALKECSRESVNAAARRHLRPADLRTTVGLPAPVASID
jgi:zinc protease